MQRSIIIFIVLFYILNGCNNNAIIQPKDYPYLVTHVSQIDSTGATLMAEILDFGDSEIADFGFILNDGTNEYKYSLYNNETINNFRLRISSDLVYGTSYSCKAYIKTEDYLVLGLEAIFTSLGCKSPIIEDFNPKEGFDKTLVTLTGKYFSLDPSNNSVFVNSVQAPIVSSNNDTIVFITPQMADVGDVDISVMVGSKTATIITKFNIIGPAIESVSLLSAHSGEIITLEGKNFIQNGNNVNVFFDSESAVLMDYSETRLDVIVPPAIDQLLSDKTVTIRFVNGLKEISYKNNFLIKKSWSVKQAPPFDWNYWYQGFTYNGNGHILELNTKELYKYDPNTNVWDSVYFSYFPGERIEGGIYVPHGDKLFKAGGFEFTRVPLSELWEYSFSLKSWARKNELPFTIYNAVYFERDDQIYVITDEGQVWKCDFENEGYEQLKNFPVAFTTSFGMSFISNYNAYVVTNGRMWQYDVQNDSWIEKANCPVSEASYYNKGFGLNNTGYALIEGKLYKYDFINDRWIYVSQYPGCGNYYYGTKFTINSVAYLVNTGSSSWGCSPVMFAFEE